MGALMAKLKEAKQSAAQVPDRGKPKSDQRVRDDSEKARDLVSIFVVSGVAILLVYAFGEAGPLYPVRSWLRLFAGFLLLGGAGFAFGSLTGFLFGIPRSLQGRSAPAPRPQTDPAPSAPAGSASGPSNTATDREASKSTERPSRPEPSYASNTNLEEISDWLTKIIVGVGLINLKAIPGSLKGLAVYFASLSLCPAGCAPIPESSVLAILSYFSICGFFLAYLLTRLELPAAFSRADRRAALEMRVSSLSRETEDIRKENLSLGKESASLRARILTKQATDLINRADEPPLKGTPGSEAQLNEALRIITEALTHDETFAVAYVERARAQKRLCVLKGDEQFLIQALESIEKACELDDKNYSAFYNSACYKSLLKKPIDEIMRDLLIAISLNPAVRVNACKDGDLAWARETGGEKFNEALNC
jgi:hypothetical protein